MKKTSFLSAIMFVFLLVCSAGIKAQSSMSNLDQDKLMHQTLGIWEANVGKDSVLIRDTQQYGRSFIQNVYYNIKGKKTPYYTNNYCLDSKEGNIKGFVLYADGRYDTWIAFWTSEKKLYADIVQNFNPKTVLYKIENVFETPTKMTWINLNADGKKEGEFKFNKVK